jgi:hypothetical protein
MKLENVEASLFRYLYEQLEVVHGIRLMEAINLDNFDDLAEWVVVAPLSNVLGFQPKQLFFLHAAVQKVGDDESIRLARLVDKVLSVMDQGTRIDAYDVATGELTGEMEVSDMSISPVLRHASGGSFRSITIGVVYA